MLNVERDRALDRLIVRQHGVVSRSQTFEIGFTRDMIRRRIAADRWTMLGSGVYLVRPFELTWHARLWRSVQSHRGVAWISHDSAAALYELPTFGRTTVVLSVPHGSRRHLGPDRVVQVTDMMNGHFTMIDGLPITSPARTIFDLGARLHRSRIEKVAEHALRSGLVDCGQLAAVLEDLARPGKLGVRSMRNVISHVSIGPGIPESKLETKLRALIHRFGLSQPKWQFPHPSRERLRERVDAAYPEERLIVEADGRKWHTLSADFELDRRRDRDALALGWVTIRLTWDDIEGHPARTAEEIRRALQAGRARSTPSTLGTVEPRNAA
jgi:very-short-patch-repair endonuclease